MKDKLPKIGVVCTRHGVTDISKIEIGSYPRLPENAFIDAFGMSGKKLQNAGFINCQADKVERACIEFLRARGWFMRKDHCVYFLGLDSIKTAAEAKFGRPPTDEELRVLAGRIAACVLDDVTDSIDEEIQDMKEGSNT